MLPLFTVIRPPLPILPSQTLRLMLPPVPEVADPVTITTEPLLPLDATPVRIRIPPLTPAEPASDVFRVKEPLDVLLLVPVEMDTEPPVRSEL